MTARTWLDRAVTRTGIGRLVLSRGTDRLRILCYHGIWAAPGPHFGDKLFMSPEKFEARMRLIQQLRLEVLPLREAFQLMREGRLPPRAAAITIDDGWATTFTHMLPVLERHGYPATIYVQSERIDHRAPVADVALRYALEQTRALALDFRDLGPGEDRNDGPMPLAGDGPRQAVLARLDRLLARVPIDTHHGLLVEVFARLGLDYAGLERSQAFDLTDPATLADADRRGFEIALHTHTHSLGDFSGSRIAAEIDRNRKSLATILGRPPASFRHFCWPSGDYTNDAIAHLRATGVDLATSCNNGLARASDEPLILPRLLDGEYTSDDAFVTMASGIHSQVERVVSRLRH